MFSFKNLTRKKPIEKSVNDEIVPTYRLYDLITYGIAATVGSGVYAVVGRTAREVGGSIVLSTGLSGLVSLITAFCYLEFASKIPASGSSYTYAYSTIGELIGWFIGWNLTLEYSFAAASIAGAWSQSYLPAMFKNINVKSMISDNILPQYLYNLFPSESGEFRINIMAGLLIGVFTLLALMGTKAGSKFNNFITSLNLLVILVIIIFGLTHFNIENMDNFFKSGFEGVSKGAQQMFFSYIGFDTICTLSAEAKRPKKDIPIAVMTTIAVATTLYIGAGLSIVGMVGADNITKDSPLINAFESVGKPLVGKLVGGCALLCMMATLFACIVGQPRIFYAMAKDGLLPKRFGVLNKGGNATFGIIFTGLITALNAMFIHDEYTEDMVSFGSLLGFSVIAASLIVLRTRNRPQIYSKSLISIIVFFFGTLISSFLYHLQLEMYGFIVGGLIVLLPFIYIVYLFFSDKEVQNTNESNEFSCPFVPFLPCFAILLNNFLVCTQLVGKTGDTVVFKSQVVVQFLVWTLIGLVIYFSYGIKNSLLGKQQTDVTDNEVSKSSAL